MHRRAQLACGRGAALYAQGQYAKALAEFEAAARIYGQHPPRDPHRLAGALSDVALCLWQVGRPADGLPKARAAWQACQRAGLRQGHPDAVKALNALAHCLRGAGRQTEALPKAQAALAMCRSLHKDQDHAAVAHSRNNVALCLHALGRPAEALKEFQAALDMRQRLYKGRDHLDLATSLNNVASCLDALGESAEALPKHKAALAMRQRLFKGKDHPDVASSLNNVALCLEALGRYGQALSEFQAALAMFQRLHKDEDHPFVAVALNNVASCLDALGRSDEALPKYTAALKMRKRLYKGRDHPDVAASLNNVGGCLESLGRSGDALAQFQRALAMFRRLYRDQSHPCIATSLDNVAFSLYALGRFGEALAQFQSALAMRKKLCKGKDHPDVAFSLSNVASCLDALGRSDEALTRHKAALAMTKRLFKDKDHPDAAASLNDLGLCLYGLRRFGEALPYFQAALAMYGRIHAGEAHPFLATSLSNVASCLDALGRSAEALPKHEAAMKMTRQLFKERDHPDVAAVLSDVGLCLHALGRSAEALKRYRAALVMAERLRSPETFKVASHLGRLYLDDLDKPAEAVKALARAVAGMERARVRVGGHELDRARYFAHVRRWGAFETMTRAQLRLGRADKALEYAERGRALGLRDVLERGKRLQGGDLLGPVEAAARARGDAALLRAVSEARKRQREALSNVSSLTAQIRLLRSRTDLTEEQRGRQIRQLNARLAEAHREHLSARRAVFNLAGTHAALDLKPLTADQIQVLLGKNELLLIYTLSDKESVLLLVPPPGEEVQGALLKWPGGKPMTIATLDESVTRYLSGMMTEARLARGVVRQPTDKHSPADHGALGYRLFTALVPPAIWQRVKRSRRIYVVPDGILHRLPFETLIVEEPKGSAPAAKDRRYWLDVGPPLVYGPSATVLVNRKEARDAQLERAAAGGAHVREAALLGDPIFERPASGDEREPRTSPASQPGRSGGGDLSSRAALAQRTAYITRYGALRKLPGTRAEIQRIYYTLVGTEYKEPTRDKRVAVLLAEDATRTRLYAAAAGCRYLHLATHGLVDSSDKAIYSSLALTQPPVVTPQDFGFLTLVDLFDNWWGRLGATELVVLSACRTQRGRIEPGEGVFGISWGFLYAGAPAVVASLWDVDDTATALLMWRFYGSLKAGKPKAEALRDAKHWLRQLTRTDLKTLTRKEQALRPLARGLSGIVTAEKGRRVPDALYAAPHYWAGFVYLGDPR